MPVLRKGSVHRYEEPVTLVCHTGSVVVTDEAGEHSLSDGDQVKTTKGGCSIYTISDGANVFVLNEPTDDVHPPEDKRQKQPASKFREEPRKSDLDEQAKALGVEDRSKKNKKQLAKAVKRADQKSDHPVTDDRPKGKASAKSVSRTENKPEPKAVRKARS